MTPETLSGLYARHRAGLWGLVYRMLGDGAEAEDVVQEVFARALSRPPDASSPIRPWLVTVALNLARDRLRQRKRRQVGLWLPSAEVAQDRLEAPLDAEPPAGAEVRYALMESASMAFLVALEALTPQQRAVLLLRSVYGYTGQETGALLDLKPNHVKVVLHRARQALARYDRSRCAPALRAERTREALGRLMAALAADDLQGLMAELAPDVVALSDGGERYSAARRPVVGAEAVARLYLGLARKRPVTGVELREVNGLPALWLQFEPGRRVAPESLLVIEVDASGRLVSMLSLLDPDKLTALSTA